MERKNIFWDHIKANRWPYVIGFALLSISSMLQLIIPWLLGRFTDSLQIGGLTYGQAVNFAVWMASAGLGIAFFRSASRIYMFRLSRQLEMRVRGELFAHWEKLSAQYFNNRRIGDLMSHAISDVGVIREVTMQGYYNVMEALFLIVVSVTAMVSFVNPWLTLLTMLPLPLLSLLAYRFNKQIMQQSADMQAAISDLTSRVQEFTAGIRVIKAFVQEQAVRKLFAQDNQHAVNMNRRFVRSNSLFGALSAGIVGFSFLVSVVVGGIMVLKDVITLGEFVAFNTYLSLLMGPIENLGKVVNLLQRGKASELRLLEIFNTQPDIVDDVIAKPEIDRIHGDIEIRNLTFAYPEAKRPALRIYP